MFEQESINRIKELVLPFLNLQRIELVELELKRQGSRNVLKFLVEKSGGVNLDDCIFLNREIGRIFDEHPDSLNESYILEVSSPGLDRPLTTERDFVRAMGKQIKVYLKEPFNGKLEYRGEAYDCLGSKLVLKTEEGVFIDIPLDLIQKGKREF